MTREEFEKHLDRIIYDALRIERYKEDEGIVYAYQKDVAYHCEELTKFHDRHQEEE